MRRFGLGSLAILLLVVSGPSVAAAAEPVFLQLKIQGADVRGDVALKGVEGMIECLAYEQEVTIPASAAVTAGGAAAGRRQYQPLRITKRIDQASPLLLKALTQGQAVEGTFRFYRVSKAGGVQQFYTVEIRQARVTSVKQVNPDRLVPATAAHPPLEEVAFVFNTIRWTYLEGGVTYEDMGR
jgi:type VI secretion system secreted protein Hcp